MEISLKFFFRCNVISTNTAPSYYAILSRRLFIMRISVRICVFHLSANGNFNFPFALMLFQLICLFPLLTSFLTRGSQPLPFFALKSTKIIKLSQFPLSLPLSSVSFSSKQYDNSATARFKKKKKKKIHGNNGQKQNLKRRESTRAATNVFVTGIEF